MATVTTLHNELVFALIRETTRIKRKNYNRSEYEENSGQHMKANEKKDRVEI